MREEAALLGGELSGHFFFADRYYGFDDALYAAVRLLEILSQDDRSIRERLRALPRGHFTPELRVDCPDSLRMSVVKGVERRLRDRGRLATVDGVRIVYQDGAWSLLRASNTQPGLVMRFEAPSATRLDQIQREMQAALGAAHDEAIGLREGA